MPRPERFAPAGVPIHVTQRGNFRASVFRNEFDHALLLELLGRYAAEYRNRVVGYCLMPNHFHLVLIPEWEGGVSEMMRAVTGKCSRVFNERLDRSGHVWQARFWSSTLSQRHYRTALSYVDLNPVRAGMVADATEYRWSSAAAHAGLCAYPAYLDKAEFTRMYSAAEWTEILRAEEDKELVEELRRATRFGRVSGGPEFVKQMELIYGRALAPKPPGRPRKSIVP